MDSKEQRPVSNNDSQSVLEAGDVVLHIHPGEKSYGVFEAKGIF